MNETMKSETIMAAADADKWTVEFQNEEGSVTVEWPKSMHPLVVKLCIDKLLKASITYDGIRFDGSGEWRHESTQVPTR